MINVIDPSKCCGCTACASICTHNAISMCPDNLGFLYPKTDMSKCVDCGLCDSVCTFNDNYDISLNFKEPEAFGVRHKNSFEVDTSRSGAAFIAFSDRILEHKGVVYGAGYTKEFDVVHKRAETKLQRDEFKGSKYVQSDLRGIFHQIKNDLKAGKLVMFSGTPCQTSALASYIGDKLRENLFLIDIVCHGVPGPNLWHDYLKYLEKNGKKISSVNFRDKRRFGWAAHKESFMFGDTYYTPYAYPFSHMFYQHIALRQSCGNCHFCNIHRPSDITLADFWGWEKTDQNINSDDKGISLVLLNTAKGKSLFESVVDEIVVVPANLKDCMQPNLQHPTILHPERMEFERIYSEKGFEYTMSKYGYIGFKRNVDVFLDGVMKNVIYMQNVIIRILRKIKKIIK